MVHLIILRRFQNVYSLRQYFLLGKDGNLIPQIVMNPWDPNQAPVMTLAPLANAMQAYQQQWLMQQQAGGQNQEGNSNSAANAGQQNSSRQPDGQHPITSNAVAEKEEENYNRERVVCVAPDEEMGFLLNLPPPCNVLLQPSSVGISGKPRESPFNISFQKFLKGMLHFILLILHLKIFSSSTG